MRKKQELLALEQTLSEDLWYARHMTWELPKGTPPEILAQAEAAAERIRASRDPEYLHEITHDTYAVGRLHGRLMVVRWCLGWSEADGLLDT